MTETSSGDETSSRSIKESGLGGVFSWSADHDSGLLSNATREDADDEETTS